MRSADPGSRAPAPALVAYFMVDRRRRGRYRALAAAARSAGATHVELGFPFSDPIADGPVLQAVADRALRSGTDWTDLLAALREARRELPPIVMSYANPLLVGGLPRRLGSIAQAGARGLIVPDLSLEESGPWAAAARTTGLDLILLAAPGSSTARARSLARASRGFLYLVSRYGTTGAGEIARPAQLVPIVRAAHRAAPQRPVYVGFGIRDAATARSALRAGADGVIVASALESALEGGTEAAVVRRVLRPIAGALRSSAA
ncbi:MAG: tryptophan synthase subunit alpha [Thermoplasmata archaeon]